MPASPIQPCTPDRPCTRSRRSFSPCRARARTRVARLVVESGTELKLVYPQAGAEPERYEALAFTHWYLQPMDGFDREANTRAAIAYCLAHPRWRLSVQSHKALGLR